MYNVKRTILVGLGGTGRDAVLNAKRKIMKVYGIIPPSIKFLVFDTTASKNLDTVKLDPTEFVHLKVRNIETVLRNRKSVKKWFPEETPLKAILDGAGQIRALGRIALHANFQEISRAIDTVVKDVRNFKVGRVNDNFFVQGNDVSVSIVSSTSGGTGSGTFLEIAWIFRKFLDSNDKITGYILFPDIFSGLPGTDNVQANCYGAIKELDYFMNISQDHDLKIEFEGDVLEVSKPPYNLIYVINNRNKENIEYSEIPELTEFLGTGLFLTTGDLKKTAGDIWDNLGNQIAGKRKVSGKSPLYSSFGISELVYDGKKLENLFLNEVALRLLNAYNTGSTFDANKETQDFIDRCNIREDKDRDDVIDAILPISVRAMELPEFKRGAAKRIEDIKNIYIANLESEYERSASANLNEIIISKVDQINGYINNCINTPGGLDLGVKFINNLLGVVSAFKDMMITEKEKYLTNCSRVQNKYKSLTDDISESEKKFWGAERAIEETCLSYQNNAKQEVQCKIENIRRDKAITFFSITIDELKNRQKEINDIQVQINQLIQTYSSHAQQIRSRKHSIKPFIINLEDSLVDKIDVGNIDVSDFLRYLSQNDKPISTWFKYRTEEINNTILEYCCSKAKDRNFTNTNIENEITKLSETEKMKLVNELDKMAVPLWQYNHGIVDKTEMIYLFGVPDGENTIMSDENIQNSLEGKKYKPSIISINDPYRIIFFKIEASAPAYAIFNIAGYRKDYNDPNSPFNYHIDKNWQDLPDLFPDSDDEEGKKYWALGFVPEIGLIDKSARYYRYKSKLHGKEVDDFWIKIPESKRKLAMQKFLEQEEFVDEIKDSIESKIRILGEEKIIDAISRHIDDFREKGKKADEETKKQVEQELKLLRGYLQQFQTV